MQGASPTQAAGQPASSRVAQAFADAGQATGMKFGFLLQTAMRESSLEADAAPSTSSARGYFQFVEQTWLEMVHKEGAEHGLGDLAQSITRGANGRFGVADAETRQQILDLREDPDISARMAGAYARQNAETLQDRLGRPVSEGEVYLAHVFGANGAGRMIEMAERSPDRAAYLEFPKQAAANRGLFYANDGTPRSLNDLYAKVVRGFSDEPMDLTPPPLDLAGHRASEVPSARMGFFDRGAPQGGLFAALYQAQALGNGDAGLAATSQAVMPPTPLVPDAEAGATAGRFPFAAFPETGGSPLDLAAYLRRPAQQDAGLRS